MKRILLATIMVLSSLIVQAEHDLALHNTLNGEQDYHYIANDHILLSSGFKSEPSSGHEVTLEIDSYAISPPQSGINGGPASSDNGVVGSLEGVVDVSLLGGAVYSIPIVLPDGLGGIKPQLSITYNSQSHNGLLGWAWDLNGISYITRTNKTIYHDGSANTLDYSQDRFCIDGKRLMKVEGGNYGGNGTSYRTEQDLMSKIVSYTESGITGPSYFKVWTADGNILYYGNTEDSKIRANGQPYVNIWLLKKVEDRNGNFLDYHYSKTSDTYRLIQINYSGNTLDDIGPAFCIEFQYEDRDDIEVLSIGNCLYRQDKILKGVIVKNGKNQMNAYQFSYKAPNPQKGYPYHLLANIKLSAGNRHLNPTRIQWGNGNYNVGSSADVRLNVTTNGEEDAFINAVKFSGDFNGDGYSDVVSTRPDSQGAYTTANVFINRGVNGDVVFDLNTTIPLSSDISWIYVADFNGDGLDDILLSNRIRKPLHLQDQLSADVYLSHIQPSGALSFNLYHTPTCKIPRNLIDAHLIGDFFGEGKCSVLIQSVSNNKTNNSSILTYDESSDQFQLQSFPENLPANRFYSADYNGDGITEILYKNSNGLTNIVQLTLTDNSSYHYSITYTGSPVNWEDCFPGDFNGDGLTDALFYKSGSSTKWTIQLSTRNGMNGISYNLPASFPYSSPGNYLFSLDQPHNTIEYIKTGDFDGNGCSDIGLFKDNLFYVFYGPMRTTGNDAPFSCSQRIATQFFNCYNNMVVCLGNFLGQERLAYLGGSTVSYLPRMTTRHEVQKITDGFCRVTEFQYDYLMPNLINPNDNDFYRLTGPASNLSSAIHYTAIPLRALKRITKYNLKNKPIVTNCYYTGGLLHTRGKGFLGFSSTRQEDHINNQLQKKTIRRFDINSIYGIIHLMTTEESVFDRNDQLMAKSIYNNCLYSHLRNNKVFIPKTDKTLMEYDIDHPGVLMKKEIHGTTVATHCSQSFRYDDVLSVTRQIVGFTGLENTVDPNQCEFQSITNTTYSNDNLSNWIINRPATITSISHRSGNYADICHHKAFTYCSNNNYLIQSVLDIPNDGTHPEDRLATMTYYLYDIVGNVRSKTISTPNDNLAPRTESYEYSKAYGCRLLTKRTNAMNESESYSYDPVYNYRCSTTDCNGLVTLYEQDPFAITCTTQFPDGNVSYKAVRWGDGGYYQWEKKTGGETKITNYKYTGEVFQQQSYGINGELLRTNMTYDDFGRITQKSFPFSIGESPVFINYYYDGHNRINRIVHADGTYETVQYNGNQKSSSFVGTNGVFHTDTKTFNLLGWLTKSTDTENNSVIYDYYSDGKLKSFQIEGQNETRIEMTYDALGNRISLSDPNYGLTTSRFNAFNELEECVSSKNFKTQYFYDVLGRTVKRIETDDQQNISDISEWFYGQDFGQRGLLTSVTSANQTTNYEYDKLLRLTKTTENILGTSYQTQFSYDNASRITNIVYPSDYAVNYCYTSEGYLRSVMDSQSKVLWKTAETNSLMQPTTYVTGNGYVTSLDYEPNTHQVTSIKTKFGNRTIQDYSYQYDCFSNMTQRDHHINSLVENFAYDDLNRLVNVTDRTGTSHFTYDDLGRMTEKTTPNGTVFSNADYSGPRPHAIKTIQASPGVFPQERMDLVFNAFDKVSMISEGLNTINFVYGYDHQRIKTSEKLGNIIRNKIYVGNCEYISSPNCSTITRTMISGPLGVFAVAETRDGETSLYYIHKDHLGSWTHVSDSLGTIKQIVQFDAWGCCTDPNNLRFDRGYTGHEHIKGVNLINMDGRIYDPLTSSMLNPDNNIQMPDYPQNLNRYSYCLNNPLSYSDPSGNTVLGTAFMYYLWYCTDFGYEWQKRISPIALHADLHLSSQQLGFGLDASIGMPKNNLISMRFHAGATYYLNFYDNSYQGMELRTGMEWCALGLVGISGTTFTGKNQTTNALVLGNANWNVIYENDYMFHMGDNLLMGFTADGGDRLRSAAAKIRIGPFFQTGVNLFTGDPGLTWDLRDRFYDPNVESKYYDYEQGGRETYTSGIHGNNPDEYRAGVFYVGFGPIRIGENSEQVRNVFQNKFAHDFLCKGDSPYFRILDRPRQFYFYFGSGTGNTLW